MKKILLLFAFFCGLAANSLALTFVVGGVNYNVVSAVSPYTVEVIAKAPIYTGAVTIPAQVINGATTYSVVRIGQQAFQNCVGLTSVTMPNSVTDINLSAFAGCTALTNVVFSTALVNIRGYAFTGCSSLAQINFPANLLVIDNYAFRGCNLLTSVTIPVSVATIGVGTFAKCAKLSSFTVSANNYFFKSANGAILSKNGTTLVQCPTGISSFVIPTGVTKLANFSLSESPNLQTVFIPSSVASIGESAFSNCTLLDSIDCNVTTPPVVANANAFLNLPQNAALLVPSASVNAYKAATHWKSFVNIKVIKLSSHTYNGIKYSVLPNTNNVEVVANTAEYDYADDIIIPETIYFNDQNYTVTKIGNSAFNDNDSFRSITMPNTVTEIGRYAFFQCINIVTVQLSTSLQKIGEGAFMRCYSMENITALPASLKEIGRVSFADCSRLTTLTIPKGTTTIGAAAFSGGKKLNDLVLENGNAAYKQVEGAIFTINEDTLMYVPSGKTSYTIPHTVKCINDAAFSSCSLLTSITIPSTVQNIGINAFEYCNGLIEITIPQP